MSERSSIEFLKDIKDGHDQLEAVLWNVYELLTQLGDAIEQNTPSVKRWANFIGDVRVCLAGGVRDELLKDAEARIDAAMKALGSFRELVAGLKGVEVSA